MTAEFDRFVAQLRGTQAGPISGFLSFSGKLSDSQVQEVSAALKDSNVTGIRLEGMH